MKETLHQMKGVAAKEWTMHFMAVGRCAIVVASLNINSKTNNRIISFVWGSSVRREDNRASCSAAINRNINSREKLFEKCWHSLCRSSHSGSPRSTIVRRNIIYDLNSLYCCALFLMSLLLSSSIALMILMAVCWVKEWKENRLENKILNVSTGSRSRSWSR